MIGRSIPRVEDAALVTGEAEFADDAPLSSDAGHACFVRSPWPHADIVSVETGEALAMDGVHAVLTGTDAAAWSDPLLVGVRAPVEHRCLATDRVRYAGEPVAVVVARDRYLAEDAAERVEVEYAPRPAIVDPEEALDESAPVLHEALGTNLVHERSFRYGDPEAAFRAAPHRIEVEVRYPRNVCTPIEGVVVTAAWLSGEGVYEVHSNFQGPYSLHPVMARALRVPGSRLRLRAARNSGGSFGVKQSAFVDIVALALASRAAGRPVRWTQDRMENLSAATSATNRVGPPRGGGRRRWAGAGASLRPGRGLRCLPPRPRARHPVPDARSHDRCVRRAAPRGPKSGRAHQQDPDRPQPRVRRSAGVLRLGDAHAAGRGAARPRPSRRHPPEPRSGHGHSLPGGGRRPVRLGRFPGPRRSDGRGRRARRAPRPPARGAVRWKSLRGRVRGDRGDEHLQHGLHHRPARAGDQGAGGSQGRSGGDRHGEPRPGRRGHRECCLGAPGAGPSHRARPGGGRGPRARPGGGRRQPGARYPDASLVDRVGQLLEPVRGGGGGGRSPRRGPGSGAARGGGRARAERAPGRARLRGGAGPSPGQPGQRHCACPPRRRLPLVALVAPGGPGAGLAGDGDVVAPRPRAPRPRGSCQRGGRLRVRVRLLRRRGGPGDRSRPHRSLCDRTRLGGSPPPRNGGRADPGGVRARGGGGRSSRSSVTTRPGPSSPAPSRTTRSPPRARYRPRSSSTTTTRPR